MGRRKKAMECDKMPERTSNGHRRNPTVPSIRSGCEKSRCRELDRWFLVQIKEIVDFEEELAGAKT
jgi:hypothetical protein